MSQPTVTTEHATAPVVVARDLKQVYKISRGFMHPADHLQAVSGVSFTCSPARRWPWWANRVVANPHWHEWCR